MADKISDFYASYLYDGKTITFNKDDKKFTIHNPEGIAACKWQGTEIPKKGTWFVAHDYTVAAVNLPSHEECRKRIAAAGTSSYDFLHVPHLHDRHTAEDIERTFGVHTDLTAVPKFKRAKTATAVYAGLLDIARALDIRPQDVCISPKRPVRITVGQVSESTYDPQTFTIRLQPDCRHLGKLWMQSANIDFPDTAAQYLQYRCKHEHVENILLISDLPPIKDGARDTCDKAVDKIRTQGKIGHYPHPDSTPVTPAETWKQADALAATVLFGASPVQPTSPDLQGEKAPQTAPKQDTKPHRGIE